MDFFYNTMIYVPLYQVGLMLLISTLALLFGMVRLSLLVNYAFTIYWGYVLNREMLLGSGFEKLDLFTALYFIFGGAVFLLAALGFMASGHK